MIQDQVQEHWGDSAGLLHWITVVPFLRLLEDDIYAITVFLFQKMEEDLRALLHHQELTLPFNLHWTGTVIVENGVIDNISKQVPRLFGVHGIQNYLNQYALHQLHGVVKSLIVIANDPKTKKEQTWWFLPRRLAQTRVVANNVVVSLDKDQELVVEVDWRSSYHEEL